MLKDAINTHGTVTFELKDKDGNVKKKFSENMVVSTGIAFITNRVKNGTGDPMSHMALGTSAMATNTAHVGLQAEIGRVALDSVAITTQVVGNDTIEFVATFGAGVATGSLSEAGLFNAGVGGVMLARTVFAAFPKNADETLTLTWRVRFF